jgi:hypothetical protein
MSRKATGIEVRHQRVCPTKHGRRCTCKPTYRAEAFSVIENRRVRKTFQSLAAAKAWRADAQSALKQGTMSAARSPLGRKGMLLGGLSVFGLASFAGGLTDSPGQLIAARAVMGVGAAMVFPSTLSLIANVFTERRERALVCRRAHRRDRPPGREEPRRGASRRIDRAPHLSIARRPGCAHGDRVAKHGRHWRRPAPSPAAASTDEQLAALTSAGNRGCGPKGPPQDDPTARQARCVCPARENVGSSEGQAHLRLIGGHVVRSGVAGVVGLGSRGFRPPRRSGSSALPRVVREGAPRWPRTG